VWGFERLMGAGAARAKAWAAMVRARKAGGKAWAAMVRVRKAGGKAWAAMAAAIAVAALPLALIGCAGGGDRVTLVLDWTPNTNHTGFYVALELGFYEDEGMEVTVMQPPEDGAVALVAAGRAEFGISFQEEVLIAANAGEPLPIVAVASIVDRNAGGVMSLAEAGITRFRDLEGKRFGSWQVDVYDEIVRECVRLDGGDPAKVEFVPNLAMDSLTGLRRDYDAVWVYEGWDVVIAGLSGVAVSFVPFRDMGPAFDYYSPVLIMNAEKVGGDLAERFLRASGKGFAYAKENPAAAAVILHKYAPEVSLDIILASQEVLSASYYEDEWGLIDRDRWLLFYDWMKGRGLLPADAGAEALADGAWGR